MMADWLPWQEEAMEIIFFIYQSLMRRVPFVTGQSSKPREGKIGRSSNARAWIAGTEPSESASWDAMRSILSLPASFIPGTWWRGGAYAGM
jgi:hypothetical protein